jgi:hypothetical protein
VQGKAVSGGERRDKENRSIILKLNTLCITLNSSKMLAKLLKEARPKVPCSS